DVTDLRADVQAYPGDAHMLVRCRPAAKLACATDRHSEFMLAQAGGDIRVRLGGNVGGYAQRDVRGLSQLAGALRQQLKLAFTLDIELQNAMAEGQFQLGGCLAYAGKDNLFDSFLLRTANALQFASGNNIEAGPHARQKPQDAQV